MSAGFEDWALPQRLGCRPRRVGDRIQWRVWAPKARQVHLCFPRDAGMDKHLMEPADGGFFSLETPLVPTGTRYAYQLDDGPPRPDPCSLWQPDGVHCPSAFFDPDEFSWTDSAWQGISREEVIFYELHVGTFTPEGTFEAIIPRLPALRELGVTAIELMPVAQFPGARNWGYDGVHLFAAQNTYGGPRGLQKLVDAAHAHGLAIFLDVVFNHFGPEGNYVDEFGHYYSDRYRTPWGPAFNFDDRHSDPVRDFVLENVEYWIGDLHFDGLRLDAVHAMFDISPQHILSEIKQVSEQAGARHQRSPLIVVESLMNDVRMIQSQKHGGYGLDAEWNEDFHHAVSAYLTGERHGKYIDFGDIEDLPRVLENTYLLSGKYSRFRGRRWGAPVAGLPGDRFIIGIQNHDHVGNRALGERINSLVGMPVARLAASLMLLAPHLPFLFMGEEYGESNPFQFFCSFGDPQLIESVRSGRRRDYDLEGDIPDPQAESTFTASRLGWSWPTGSARAGLRQLYRDLIEARKTWPALRNWRDRAARLWPEGEPGAVVELIRGDQQQPGGWIVCYFNMTGQPEPLPTCPAGATRRLFRSEAAPYVGAVEQGRRLPGDLLLPYECQVFGIDGDQ